MTKHRMDWSRCKYRKLIQIRMRFMLIAIFAMLVLLFVAFLVAVAHLP